MTQISPPMNHKLEYTDSSGDFRETMKLSFHTFREAMDLIIRIGTLNGMIQYTLDGKRLHLPTHRTITQEDVRSACSQNKSVYTHIVTNPATLKAMGISV